VLAIKPIKVSVYYRKCLFSHAGFSDFYDRSGLFVMHVDYSMPGQKPFIIAIKICGKKTKSQQGRQGIRIFLLRNILLCNFI
jgi:hypothetical protein